MMKTLGTLFVLLTSTLMFVQTQPYSYSYSSTIVGDIRIQTLNNGSLYCDSMICPQGTLSCKVTKNNDPNDFQKIIRTRRCFDSYGTIIAEQTLEEENTYNSRVNMQVSSGGGVSAIYGGGTVRQMTPEEQRELEEYLRATGERVQTQVAGTLNQIQTNLAPFLDGSFAANLNNQIQTSIRNSFY